MMRLLLVALFLRCSAAVSSGHPYVGCLKMQLLGPIDSSLGGDYDFVHSHAWRREVDGIWRYLTVEDEGGRFKICDEEFLTHGLCTRTVARNPHEYQAVCVYDANYCPQLVVTEGSCSGVYNITRHGYWSMLSKDGGKSIRIVDGDVFTSDSTRYECFDAAEQSEGMVSAVICENPNINGPLVHGKNVLADETVLYVVKDFVVAPDVISFELTVDSVETAQRVWIWSKNAWGFGKSSYFAFSQDSNPSQEDVGMNYLNIFWSDSNYFEFRLYDDSLDTVTFRILSVRQLARDSPHGGRIVVGRTETASRTAVALSGFSATPVCFANADHHIFDVKAAITNVTSTEFTVEFLSRQKEVHVSQSPFYYLCILAGVEDMPHLLPGMHGSASRLELGAPDEIEQDIWPGEIGHKIVVGDLQSLRSGSDFASVTSTPGIGGLYILKVREMVGSSTMGTHDLETIGVLNLFRSADPRDPMYGEQQIGQQFALAPYGGSLEKYAGCPEIYSFADWKGYYLRVSDYHWRRDGKNWNIGLVENEFCNARSNGLCTGSYTTVAMCTAAEHFCPELVVLGSYGDDIGCRGVYIQEASLLWAKSDGAHIRLMGFDPIYGRPRYQCYGADENLVGMVGETYCSTPSRVAPIFNGLNVLGDRKTYWIQRPRDMVETLDEITFKMSMMHRSRLNVWMITNSADIARGGSLSGTIGATFEAYDRTTFIVNSCSPELDVDVTLTKA